MEMKRPAHLDDASFRYGIWIAAEVASDYDKTNSHPYLVSECILGKLNVLKGKPRKNTSKVAVLIADLERRVASVEGMMRFLKFSAKESR
jgi:hypothetical protein